MSFSHSLLSSNISNSTDINNDTKIKEYSRNFNEMYIRLKFKKNKLKSETKSSSNSMDNISKMETRKLKSNSKILDNVKNEKTTLNKSFIFKYEYSLLDDTNQIENKNNINNNSNSVSRLDKIPKKPKTKKPLSGQKINLKGRFSVFLPKSKFNDNFQNENINTQETKKTKSLIQKSLPNLNACPKISRNSIEIAKKLKRLPLYQNRPLNEEKFLTKSFQYFYDCNKDEQNKNTKNNKNEKIYCTKEREKKYEKFYENNLKWKKNIIESNDKKRKLKEDKLNEDISKITFKPNLNKRSLLMADLLKMNYSQDFYDESINKEALDKFKTKIKPIIINMFRNKSYFLPKKKTHFRNINSKLLLNKNTTAQNFGKKINIGVIHIDKIENVKYKKNEKKTKVNDNIKRKNNTAFDFKKVNEEGRNEKKRASYKLNVRQGGAWNQDVVNNIVLKKNQQYIVEGFL